MPNLQSSPVCDMAQIGGRWPSAIQCASCHPANWLKRSCSIPYYCAIVNITVQAAPIGMTRPALVDGAAAGGGLRVPISVWRDGDHLGDYAANTSGNLMNRPRRCG